jgi:hypothetical protein
VISASVNPFGEIFLLEIARQILQWKNRQGMEFRCLAFNLANEAVAPPGQGLDVAWCFGGVTERFSQMLDGVVDAMIKVYEGVGGPDSLAQFLSCNDLTTWPGSSSRIRRIWRGCSCSRILVLSLRGSPAFLLSSKAPKRTFTREERKSSMEANSRVRAESLAPVP